MLLPSLGDSLVQVGGEVTGRKKCVGCVRNTEGMFANPRYGKGGQRFVPSNKLSGKMGLYDQYKISFSLLGAEMVYIHQSLNCESEDNYSLTLGYIQKSRYAKNVCHGILYSVSK